MLRRPVFEVTPETMWHYEYNTMNGAVILASDSLINLKKKVKRRQWRFAYIQAKTGIFSYGQNLVDAYPYKPKYP